MSTFHAMFQTWLIDYLINCLIVPYDVWKRDRSRPFPLKVNNWLIDGLTNLSSCGPWSPAAARSMVGVHLPRNPHSSSGLAWWSRERLVSPGSEPGTSSEGFHNPSTCRRVFWNKRRKKFKQYKIKLVLLENSQYILVSQWAHDFFFKVCWNYNCCIIIIVE